ncbi:hypothetical protein [Cellvibrio japonicus]|nr:hypothetical protein [Cellvibrio japonicus]QEI12066.1 hypothetical protein FY117_07395 [Cellvibrio japonicus]QEI15640.1 hypothetical protein FY116_07400 [Cellvibrio japonicus]QEI19218.1 hypothetical protein FY115_07395 [Cellvibrio japonicus]
MEKLFNIDREILGANYVDFNCSKVTSAQVLWINKNSITDKFDKEFDEKLFLDQFGYAVVGNRYYDEIVFDISNKKYLQAERYGGLGVGINAGGARCGNLNGVQIKGVGKNILAGESNDEWYSYGGLNLVDAIYEAIYSTLLNRIMPLGTVAIHGVILLGEKTAMLPGLDHLPIDQRRGYGALLVRDICIRPAHFLKASSSRISIPNDIISEEARVRRVNRNFYKTFTSVSGYIKSMGQLLFNYANQFAFSRMARLSHGSISPSNISIDGRWLDLTNTTFLGGGHNIGGKSSFYSEPDEVIDFFCEMVYTFSKYNKLKLNVNILTNYFFEQFDSFLRAHTCYVLGISYKNVKSGSDNPDLINLSRNLAKIINSAKKISPGRPVSIQSNDPLLSFLRGIFSYAFADIKDEALDVNHEVLFIDDKRSFLSLIRSTYNNLQLKNISLEAYLTFSFLLSIKRFYVTEFFFMGRLESYIYNEVLSANKDGFYDLISIPLNVADWSFDKDEADMLIKLDEKMISSGFIIFKDSGWTLCFDPVRNVYLIDDTDSNTLLYECPSFCRMMSYIKNNNLNCTVLGYDFSHYLHYVENALRVDGAG